MSTKEKLIITITSLTMLLCLFTIIGWITNGIGNTAFDLKIPLSLLESLKGLITIIGGLQF